MRYRALPSVKQKRACKTDHRYLFHPYLSIREGVPGVSGLNRFLRATSATRMATPLF
jgi:hypothetical protein